MRNFGKLTFSILFALTVLISFSAQAQTFKVIHQFTGTEGQSPYAGLTMDAAGRLYGTTSLGGTSNYGTVFRMTPSGSHWVLTALYNFAGGDDGACPWSRVIFGPDGSLYGTTSSVAPGCHGRDGYGTVFSLHPPATACKAALCPWRETILHAFGGNDGYGPTGDLIFDGAGNLFGTTRNGGPDGLGNVYELTPMGGGWTENNLYTFVRNETLNQPSAGVIFDKAGNLYGTAQGAYYGGVFELTPSGGGWVYNEVYALHGGVQGGGPLAGLIFDDAGNLYSATALYGAGEGGTVFELKPSSSGWNYALIYSFTGPAGYDCGPWGTLVSDGAGNLYGTTLCDGVNNAGSVFRLTPSGNNWTYTSLHDFTGGSDGGNPISNVIFDTDGNLYGTTSAGGRNDLCSGGCGVVFEIAP